MAKAPVVIKHYGEPQEARTLKGKQVTRQDSLFVIEWGAFVPCAPYDDHFIYASREVGESAYMCTCGSPAVVAHPHDPKRRMFVCLAHAQSGKHMTSVVNIKDFDKVAGGTVKA